MRQRLPILVASLGFAAIGAAQQWSVSHNGNILEIGYDSGWGSSQYAAIHLDSSYLRMIYGPTSGWGTSIVVMPSYWSFGYHQGYPSAEMHQVVGQNLMVGLHAVSGALITDETITFYPPFGGAFQASVQATTSGNISLDNRPGEAFKPLMLSSMHESSTSWDASAPYVGATAYGFPTGGWILSPSPAVVDTRFGLSGGSSSWKPNAPAVDVHLSSPMQIAGWLNTDTNPNDDNVGYWCASSTVLRSWSYDLTASSTTMSPEAISGHVTLQSYSSSAAGATVRMEIRPQGSTTPMDSQTVTLDAAGNFSLTTWVPPGVYDVAVKGSHWLRKTLTNVTIPHSGLSGLNFSLTNGDVNGDNAVTLGDFAMLRGAYGSSAGDASWFAGADLNGDGAVTLGDFAILRSQYGAQGDP